MGKVHCKNCGKPTRYQDGLCRSCRTTPAPATASATAGAIDSDGGKKKMKKDKKTNGNSILKIIGYVLALVIILVLATIIIWGGTLFIMDHIRGNKTNLDGAATTSTDAIANETDTTAADKTNSNDYQVGEPADVKDINESVWNEPYADAVMVDANGTSIYTQSGKDDSTVLSGTIPSNTALVIDSYNLTVNGKSYTNGNLLVITNDGTTDKDIANYGISYTNGCAQLISTANLQTLLDSNIAVKFARGDWDLEKDQWSYSPWALENLWIPTGYTYNPLTLTYVTDTYSNKDNATDTSVNTSGANTK